MAQKVRVALAIFGLGVLSIIAVELVARTGIVLYEQFIQNPVWFDQRAQSPAYTPSDQPEILYRDTFDSIQLEYRPYFGWSRSPFEGTLVNINEDGDRVTHYNSAREDSLRVWVFGGSTTWGLGASDSKTIPSYLAASLNDEWGVDTSVINLGEDGFVSSQEIARLIWELQRGERPDVVVMFDGFNDAYVGTYSPGAPGAIQNQDQFKARVENKDVWGRWIRSLGFFRATDFVLVKIGLAPDVAISEANDVPDPVLEIRALETANIWLQNFQVVSGLAETYAFEVIMALQPNLFIPGKPLMPYEQEILRDMEQNQPIWPQGTRIAYSAIQDGLQSDGYKGVYDFTDAFESITSPLYVDVIHVIGAGNRRLAELIFGAVQRELCENIPGNASRHVASQIAARCGGS